VCDGLEVVPNPHLLPSGGYKYYTFLIVAHQSVLDAASLLSDPFFGIFNR
jgi:hypothetical protein